MEPNGLNHSSFTYNSNCPGATLGNRTIGVGFRWIWRSTREYRVAPQRLVGTKSSLLAGEASATLLAVSIVINHFIK